MDQKSNKLPTIMVIIFQATVIFTGFLIFPSRLWKGLLLSLLTLVCLIFPFIISRIAQNKGILLPSGFKIISLCFIFMAQYLGETLRFYQLFWWWDLLLHAIFGWFAVIVGLSASYGIIKKGKRATDRSIKLFWVIFGFSFSICLSTLWEIFEFIGDYIFSSNMVKGGLEDTCTDLIITIITAFITSFRYFFRNRGVHFNIKYP